MLKWKSFYSFLTKSLRCSFFLSLNFLVVFTLLNGQVYGLPAPSPDQEPGWGTGVSVSITVNGTVVDERTQLPIPYADIFVVNQKKHVQTDGKGKFSLAVVSEKDAGQLVVSFIGYVSQEFNLATLLKNSGTTEVKLPLRPKSNSLSEVEVEAKAEKFKEAVVGYNRNKYADFHHEFNPLDSLIVKPPGQEIGNRFQFKSYPVYLQDITFSLAGSGNLEVLVGVHIYSLKNNLPHKDLLPEKILVKIPPHHTGWITVNLDKYNLSLTKDFAVVVEWLNDANKLSGNSLTTFASKPKGQVTYYRESDEKPWQVLKSTSIGMYVRLLYKK